MSQPSKRKLFRAAALLFPIVLILAAEGLLRCLNISALTPPPWEKENPIGFPYFERVREGGKTFWIPSRYYRPWGHGFKFEMPKPPGTTRIFSLGGSTTNGGAFGNPGAFSKWLEVMLAGSSQTSGHEVINSGQGGFPSSLVLEIEDQVLAAEPDIIVIYSGNNEFFYPRGQAPAPRLPESLAVLRYHLKRLRLVRLIGLLAGNANAPKDPGKTPAEMAAKGVHFLNKGIGERWDRENYGRILAEYRQNLEAMADRAKARGVGVVLCTVAANLRDYAPYRSLHRDGISSEDLARWEKLYKRSQQAYDKADYASAKKLLEDAIVIDDRAAEADFLLGHVLLKLGDRQAAFESFERAAIHDPIHDRAAADTNAIVREVAAEKGVLLADTVPDFREKALDGVPGDGLFLDAVHPTLEGHRIIARAILRTMIEAGWIIPAPNWSGRAEEAAAAYAQKMPKDYLFNSYYTAASLNVFLGRFRRALTWNGRALEYEPFNTAALTQKTQLETIIRASGINPALPWADFEIAFAGEAALQKNPTAP